MAAKEREIYMNFRCPLLIIGMVFSSLCHAQRNWYGFTPTAGGKTNLFYDATSTINLGAEFRLGGKTSIDVPFNYNPWTFAENKKWKHLLVQPEFRLWIKETFNGSFFGLHAHYAYYNVGHLDHPPFTEYMNRHRFEGWLAGAGVSYGYRWDFSHRWGMEATVGAGYAYLSYDKYTCESCGTKLGSETKNYFGATKAGVTLVYTISKKKSTASVVEPVYVPEPLKADLKIPYEPKLLASYIIPQFETVKERSGAGQGYLDFPAGKSTIVSGFKNNAEELQKIHTLIESVKNDAHATITGMTITGYASPEGSYPFNVSLSQKRAVALKEHIRSTYGFQESQFTVAGKGEDWITLDSLVKNSGMPNAGEILSIIRSADLPDGRERKLKTLAGGAAFRQMLAELFPQLCRSYCELSYTVTPFTVEQYKEVFKTRPGQLSLNAMFQIAQTYQKGTDEFNEVFETAAKIFPASHIANLNVAAAALERKDIRSAEAYLNRISAEDMAPADQAAYYNNMGVLCCLKGETAKATGYFSKAGAAGNREADSNAGEMKKQQESLQ
ncbi:DUF3575 domain-containing protein [Arcticibacter sp.]|uniref:DUF3575 domain-containing protein n=1 Tax=Arcticibacter sp. TaxID=1872630 RepID=UPI00388D72CC